jgi:hypothetical protein
MESVREKGGRTMSIKKVIKICIFLVILAVVIVTVAMVPKGALAACSGSQTNDSLLDGIPDYYKCAGFILAENTQNATPVCGYSAASCPSGIQLSQTMKDLFVVLEYDNNGGADMTGSTVSRISGIQDLFNYISNSASNGGLGIVVHQISTSQVPNDRLLSSSFATAQRAIRGTEDATYQVVQDGALLGSATISYASDPGIATTIYTGKTQGFIDYKCSQYPDKPCTDATGTVSGTYNNNNLQGLYVLYHKQNVVHEIAHMLYLGYDNTATHHHYASSQTFSAYTGSKNLGAGSIMEASVFTKYDSKKGAMRFYIPNIFDPKDAQNVYFH